MRGFIHISFLLALTLASHHTPAYAGWNQWTWNVPNTASGSWDAEEWFYGVTLTGTFNRLSSGWMKMTVGEVNGAEFPTVGTVFYNLEAPGFSLFVSPTLETESRIVQTVASGSCPTSAWTGNFLFSQWPGSGFDMTGNTPAFGSFTWDPATNDVTVNNIYKLASFTSLFTNVVISNGACSNGTITLVDSVNHAADREGQMYISTNSGAVYNVNSGNNSKTIYAVPAYPIDSAASLNGTYAALSYDHSSWPTHNRYKGTISGGTTLQINAATDIDADSWDSNNGWKITGITINAPSNGFFTGTLVKRVAAVDDTPATNGEVICMVYFSSQNVIQCLGHDYPGDPTRPRSFIMVSTAQTVASGTLDTLLDTDGRVSTNQTAAADDRVGGLEIQSDGKILVSGWTSSPAQHSLARFLPNGALDTYFSSDGKHVWSHTIGGTHGAVSPIIGPDVAIDGNGKIVVAGYAGSTADIAVSRFNSVGTLDTTFDSDGMATFGVHSSRADNAYRIAIDSSNRILFTGWSYYNSSLISDNITGRITETGALDTDFNSAGAKPGVNMFKFQSGSNAGNYVTVTADSGKIVTVGHAWITFGRASFTAARFLSDGTFDTFFDTDGRANYSWSTGDCQAWTGAVEPTTYKVILAGYNRTSNNHDFAVMRLTSAGALDTTFNTTGMVLTDFGNANTTVGDQIFQIALTSTGKIVAAGNVARANTGTAADVGVVRYNSDGSIDSTFSTDGMFTAAFGTTTSNTRDLAIETNTGKYVLGVETSSGNFDNGVMRIWGN
jgi:uncharacterized delta-60 repeat protein